jgi:hypothetical protein
MASASTTEFDALSEAAKNTGIPDVNDGMCGPLLMMFLAGKGLDPATRSEADWKHSFHRHRRLLKKELGDDKGQGEERSPSSESERKLETVSLSDSAYHSESPQDHVCCSQSTSFAWREADIYVRAQGDQQTLQLYSVYAVVEPRPGNPEGMIFMTGCISDDTDEDYIIQTVYERLEIPKGKDGKVGITYTPHKGDKTCRSTFAVREDVDGLADIVFARKRPARKEKNLDTGMSVCSLCASIWNC